MLLVKGRPHERGGKRDIPTLKRRYSSVIGLSNVKIIADRHKLLTITSTGDKLIENVNIDDLE